jgi:hypothetical protein
MSSDYFFRFVFPPGPTAESFGDTAGCILRRAGILHEIRRKDWGTFIAYKVLVPKFEERKAAFRLFAFSRNLASQGLVSTHHAFAPTSHWLRHGKPAPPTTWQ